MCGAHLTLRRPAITAHAGGWVLGLSLLADLHQGSSLFEGGFGGEFESSIQGAEAAFEVGEG